jgi:hypothetical protein
VPAVVTVAAASKAEAEARSGLPCENAKKNSLINYDQHTVLVYTLWHIYILYI